jgi:hypothetical protein
MSNLRRSGNYATKPARVDACGGKTLTWTSGIAAFGMMGSPSGGREPAASCSSFMGCENALNILLDPVAKRIFE